MNDLALIAIGLLFGMVLTVVAGSAAFLFYTAIQMRRESSEARRDVAQTIRANTEAINQMRGEVGLALSQMDAQRLYEASVAIQKASKLLISTTTQLNKVVYAATPPGLDMGTQTPGFTMEEEAADDARMIEERNRWLAGQQPDQIDPAQVSEFFEKRRRSGIYPIGSTPPAGGAYQAVAEQQPERPIETLPDLGPDDDLMGQGEL